MNVFDKTKGNLSHQPVEVEFLRLGVFVAELDRPWLGTPFLLQGFLIDDEAQIRQLQALCRLVYVDRRRSIGDQYVAMIRERDRRRLALGALDDDEFLAVARRLRAGMADDEARRKARPLGETGLEEELLYSAPVIEDVQRTLATIRETINSGATVDLARVCDLVDELAAGVERNPDAMLWLTRLKATDQYSYDHAIDVSVLLMVFGRFLGLGRDAVGELGRAGLMQDIGKIHVSSDILVKEEPLSDVEFREIQSHVASSLELLVGQSGFSRTVLSIVAEHHERYDGSGYPRSIGLERISLAAEMSGLVDTYCAMTRDRVFSPAISSQGALEAICRLRGVKETLINSRPFACIWDNAVFTGREGHYGCNRVLPNWSTRRRRRSHAETDFWPRSKRSPRGQNWSGRSFRSIRAVADVGARRLGCPGCYACTWRSNALGCQTKALKMRCTTVKPSGASWASTCRGNRRRTPRRC